MIINFIRELKARIYAKFATQYWRDWNWRINDVVSCPDNKFIPRLKNAGDLKGGFQLMHNGIRVKRMVITDGE